MTTFQGKFVELKIPVLLVLFSIVVARVAMAGAINEHSFIVTVRAYAEKNHEPKVDIGNLAKPYLSVGTNLEGVENFCKSSGMESSFLSPERNQAVQRIWCSRILDKSTRFGPAIEIRIVVTLENGLLTKYQANLFYKFV